ncbi:MAG: low-specificity L-threonine aldolase [Synergistaceae bacterium]|nr:low-specificity L-threonine aldolase [Synergistota bacterium]NLM71509.1 low-specificity L-threonine aldolase [Synergistaceae bacterium]
MFPVDLKSDTVTKPSQEMRRAMASAEVGDDVYGEDPTVNRLQEMAAEIMGKEAALFLPSGTMGNLAAVLSHCGRGEAAILGASCHMQNYEAGGMAALGSVVPLLADDSSGCIPPEEVRAHCRPSDIHFAPARLLCLENTHNRMGGRAIPVESIRASADEARRHGLSVHIDGARIFNAAAAWGCEAREFASCADSIQFCLSKGLGAPVGSMLCGKSDFIDEARRWRKCLGGALRQSGVLAAAGLYALEHNIDRLKEDHENAALLARLLSEGDVLKVEHNEKPTNMVYCNMEDDTGADLNVRCAAKGVLFNSVSAGRFRLVTHLDVSREQVVRAASIILEEAAAS